MKTSVELSGRPNDLPRGSKISLRRLIIVCRLFGTAPVSFVSCGPDIVQSTYVWRIYSLVLSALTLVMNYLASPTFYLNGRLLTAPMAISIKVSSMSLFVCHVNSAVYGEKLAKIINCLMRCDENTRKKIVIFCWYECFIVVSYFFSAAMTVKLAMRWGIHSIMTLSSRFLWDLMLEVGPSLCELLFLVFAHILAVKLKTLSLKIPQHFSPAWRESITEQYQHIWQLARAVNQVFEIHLLFFMLKVFVQMICGLYLIVMSEVGGLFKVALALRVIVIGSKLAVILHVCDAIAKAVSIVCPFFFL